MVGKGVRCVQEGCQRAISGRVRLCEVGMRGRMRGCEVGAKGRMRVGVRLVVGTVS